MFLAALKGPNITNKKKHPIAIAGLKSFTPAMLFFKINLINPFTHCLIYIQSLNMYEGSV